jgi:hypothetical protein
MRTVIRFRARGYEDGYSVSSTEAWSKAGESAWLKGLSSLLPSVSFPPSAPAERAALVFCLNLEDRLQEST